MQKESLISNIITHFQQIWYMVLVINGGGRRQPVQAILIYLHKTKRKIESVQTIGEIGPFTC